MSKKISELNETSTLEEVDIFPVVNDGETKKVSVANLKTELGVVELEDRMDNLGNASGLSYTKKTDNIIQLQEENGNVLYPSDKVMKTHTVSALGKNWYFKRIGNLVFMDAPSGANSANAGTNILGTLPEDFRPLEQMYVPQANKDSVVRFLHIGTNGVLTYYTAQAITSSTNCAFSCCYIAQN